MRYSATFIRAITTRSTDSVTAALNICRESMARYGFCPATRVFEAAGAGACLITDDWEGIELFLEPGREVLVARDGEEVAAHVTDSRQKARKRNRRCSKTAGFGRAHLHASCRTV